MVHMSYLVVDKTVWGQALKKGNELNVTSPHTTMPSKKMIFDYTQTVIIALYSLHHHFKKKIESWRTIQ